MARVDVLMPQMGESIAEGTLSKWLKKVGDPVKRDEPLFEISTDKVDAEIPAPAAGVLAEIKVQEGQTVPVQTLVAVLETEKGAGASTAAPRPPRPLPSPRHRSPHRHPQPLGPSPQPLSGAVMVAASRPPSSACVRSRRRSSARSRPSTASTSRGFRAADTRAA